MEVMDAILSRRSIGKVKPDPVDREVIEQLLNAAVWAPNHYRTEPWRFFVMTGEGRGLLGRAYAEIAALEAAAAGREGAEASQVQAGAAAQEQKAYRAPVVIAVAVTPTGAAPAEEELAAVHAAVQNMLLAAHSLGLGAIWRTGAPAYHPAMQAAFGLQGEERLVGFVYAGYPDMTPPQVQRKPVESRTVWLDGNG